MQIHSNLNPLPPSLPTDSFRAKRACAHQDRSNLVMTHLSSAIILLTIRKRGYSTPVLTPNFICLAKRWHYDSRRTLGYNVTCWSLTAGPSWHGRGTTFIASAFVLFVLSQANHLFYPVMVAVNKRVKSVVQRVDYRSHQATASNSMGEGNWLPTPKEPRLLTQRTSYWITCKSKLMDGSPLTQLNLHYNGMGTREQPDQLIY